MLTFCSLLTLLSALELSLSDESFESEFSVVSEPSSELSFFSESSLDSSFLDSSSLEVFFSELSSEELCADELLILLSLLLLSSPQALKAATQIISELRTAINL